ncbi:hypothetical protein FB451DRAFT_1171534 [Mycena latifolia]|nr:hypothetical protein FB451DRAFT_1171534 [Mycena latifolia]
MNRDFRRWRVRDPMQMAIQPHADLRVPLKTSTGVGTKVPDGCGAHERFPRPHGTPIKFPPDPRRLLSTMRLLSLVAITMFALVRAAPADDTLGIAGAARNLLDTFETYTPAEQEQYVARHCADLAAAKLSKIATEPDVSERLNDHGVTVGTVIAYVRGVCGK